MDIEQLWQDQKEGKKSAFFGSGRTLVVVDYVAKVVSAIIVIFPYAHRVVRQIDVAIVACVMGNSTVSNLASFIGMNGIATRIAASRECLQKTIEETQLAWPTFVEGQRTWRLERLTLGHVGLETVATASVVVVRSG